MEKAIVQDYVNVSRCSETLRALQVSVKQFDHDRALSRLLNAVLRGAAIGMCLRGGLHLLKFILSIVMRRKRTSAPVSEMLADTLRYTGFLGTLGGVFVAVDEGIALLFGRDR